MLNGVDLCDQWDTVEVQASYIIHSGWGGRSACHETTQSNEEVHLARY